MKKVGIRLFATWLGLIVFGLLHAIPSAVSLFDPAREGSDTDYACAISLETKKYKGALPGQKHEGLSDKKWYFKAAFFKDKSLVTILQFPAALLLKEGEFENFMPRHLSFINRGAGRGNVGWDRELLSVENGNLFKYTLWAEQNDDGSFAKSVDFGKRVPLYVDGKIDESYQPRSDRRGNIYFRVGEQHKRWDIRSESVEDLSDEPGVALPVVIPVPEDLNIPQTQIIDPLAVDRAKLKSVGGALENENYLNVVRELKLVMRERGVKASLKKPLSALVTSGVLAAIGQQLITDQKGDSGQLLKEQDGAFLLPYKNYLDILKWAERGQLKAKMEDASQLNELSGAVQNLPAQVAQREEVAKEVVDKLLGAKPKDWDKWFADSTKNDWKSDLVLRYLSGLSKEGQDEFLGKYELSVIKKANLKRVFDSYKWYAKK
ncbi:MAG: hypothetical protein H6679_03105 [Epsilonproteobacteria bacterium]|nr:hypothetical protein [Campylobacterota bacterium]